MKVFIVFLIFVEVNGAFKILNAVWHQNLGISQRLLNDFVSEFYGEFWTVKLFHSTADYSAWETIVQRAVMNSKAVLDYDFQHATKMKAKNPIEPFGYFLCFNSNFSATSVIKQVNQNGQWLVITELPDDIIQDILKKFWDNERIMNIFFVKYKEEDKNFRVYFYNPFLLQNNSRSRGEIFSEVLTGQKSMQRIVTTFKNRVRNLHQYTLQVHAIVFPTHMFPVYNKKNGRLQRLTGIDGAIMDALSRAMNFTAHYHIDRYFKKAEQFLKENKIDIVSDSRALIGNSVEKGTVLYPIITTRIFCVLYAYDEPRIIELFGKLLDKTGTIIFLTYMFIMAFGLYLMYATVWNDDKKSFSKCLLTIVATQTAISMPIHGYTQNSTRLIYVSALFMYLTVCSTYQAYITSQLNRDNKIKQIGSLSELSRQNYTLYALATVYNLLKTDSNDTRTHTNDLMHAKLKSNPATKNDKMIQQLATGTLGHHTGVLTRKYQAMYYQAQYFNGRTGAFKLHLINKPVLAIVLAPLVPTWSPYIRILNEKLLRVLDNGFSAKGFKDAELAIYIIRMRTIKGLKDPVVLEKKKPINWNNIKSLLNLYLLGMFIAFLLFLFEIIIHKIKKLCAIRM